MTYVAIAVIGVLGLFNVVLTMTVVRQVRRHEEKLANWRSEPGMPQLNDIPVGKEVPDFTVTTLSGQEIFSGDLVGERSLIAFFSTHCEPCKNHLPDFRDYAITTMSGPARVLAVVVGGEDEAGDFIEGLTGVASIAVQPMQGPMVTAFSVTAYPTIYQLDERGRVAASGRSVRMLERIAGHRGVPADA
ncbi:MAG: redoxin domain-containing protein [Streptosporangiaceae bacterium]|nr:redoxin domain-containing protein [Streptosporangiaceae bacterium]